ncbi:MAG: RidA family protein [Kutzneria sp.]|nr:RidA family protein [Kutzneria sp.]MBV9846444.1 RidA family protein [Kutzneria sp.]
MPIHQRVTVAPDVAPGNGYAHAVTASGRFAFVSGQVSVDTRGNPVGVGDLAAQTRQALTNLRIVLGALGADWTDVVRFTWYLTDVSRIQVIRDVRDEMIRGPLGDLPNPASSLVQVAALVRPEFLVEVEAVAVLAE